MIRFLLRRTGYSALILIGVLLLTFLLFDLAAGDPAAAALGKDPAPAEIESLRRELRAVPQQDGRFRELGQQLA